MKIRMRFLFTLCAVGLVSCASLKVEAPKDPIKVDIAMRLDVYQHVQKDIDAIENIVTGNAKEQATPAANKADADKLSWRDILFVSSTAYAEEGLGPEVERAALHRRDRLSAVSALLASGTAGEDRQGLLEIRGSADGAARSVIEAENSDRMTIYQGVASKNGTSVQDVQKLYARRLQADAPAGAPIEAVNETTGQAGWRRK